MSKSKSTARSVSKPASGAAKSGAAKAGKAKSARAQQNAMRPLWIIAGIAVIVVIAAIVLLQNRAPSSASAGMPATVSVQQANQMFQEGAFLLDVRTQEEWNEFHIDGATLIPLDQLDGRVNEIPTDKPVVIICRSGNRSAEARDLLRGYGLSQTTSVAGGMNDWRAAGFPTVSGP